MKSIVGFTHVQIGNVRINLGRRDVCMPEQRLHRTRVRAVLQEVRRKAVAQSMWRDIRYAGFGRVFFDNCPGGLPRHCAAMMQKQVWPGFAAETLAHA